MKHPPAPHRRAHRDPRTWELPKPEVFAHHVMTRRVDTDRTLRDQLTRAKQSDERRLLGYAAEMTVQAVVYRL
jgi:hypothetical protein